MACIVVAEDQAHIRHILKMWLERHGHRVIEAANGVDAVAALRSNNAELLVTDVNMPEMDGIELTRRAFDECLTLRHVFVVTSRCDQHDILEHLHDPKVSILPKPFSPSQLLRELEAVLDSAAGTGAKGQP